MIVFILIVKVFYAVNVGEHCSMERPAAADNGNS